jgi:hypothetical protein
MACDWVRNKGTGTAVVAEMEIEFPVLFRRCHRKQGIQVTL